MAATSLRLMHLARLEIEGFRNLGGEITFEPGLTVVIGENNAGKSNVIDALRAVLEGEPGIRTYGVGPSDFAHDGAGGGRVDELKISATFEGLDVYQQGRMVSALLSSVDQGTARFGIAAMLGDDDVPSVTRIGGDHDSSEIEQRATSSVCHTYLPPLRDAGADLTPGRTSRLARLMNVLTTDQAERKELESIADRANEKLAGHRRIEGAVKLVQGVLDGMTRSGHSQQTSIGFAEARFDSLVRRLLSTLGEHSPRDLAESGLGYQNLLYMAVLLSHLEEAERIPLRVLLVEEPEAHLHPQLQDLLLRYLQARADDRPNTQVIVTSNSPQFAAAADLRRVVTLSRPAGRPRPIARRMADADMTEDQRNHVRRFLDVTKAALLFARGVILVEGVSEQLLASPFAAALTLDLADKGITVVNIGGVAFEPFVRLFGPTGLPTRCAVITDGDADPDDLDGPPNPRLVKLKALGGEQVRVFHSNVTLEWDLAHENPGHELLVEIARSLHPVRTAGLPLADDGARAWATAFQRAVGDDKALLAQGLAARLEATESEEAPAPTLSLPAYLKDAIEWIAEPYEIGEPAAHQGADADNPEGD